MKNITKAITVTCLISMSAQTLAVQANRVVRRANAIVKSLELQADTLTQRELKFINNKMNAIKKVLNGEGVPTKPVGPTPKTAIYEGACWLDDDPSFDPNQTNGGKIVGTISEIIEECQYRTKATFGSVGSSGITSIQVIDAPRHAQPFECHIDDDPSHDFNQVVIGDLHTKTSKEAVSQCSDLAKMMFGKVGSSAIKF